MKRILVILSILMITGVSAQKTKVTNIKVNTEAGVKGSHIQIQWDTKNANSTSFVTKSGAVHTWRSDAKYIGTRALGFSKTSFNDRTYKITAEGSYGIDKHKVRVMRVDKSQPGPGYWIKGIVKPDFKGRTIYLSNFKGKVNKIHYGNYNRTKLFITFEKEGAKGDFLWFKQSI